MVKLKTVFRDYKEGKIKLFGWQKLGILALIIAFSGVFGWVYEFIFYYFNGGMKEFYLQGGNFLPWINIYAIGAVLILLVADRFKKHPFRLFLMSILITGILELISGWFLYQFWHVRFWDYNTEILNFGNIGGFICLRSILVFGLSALFLVYVITPYFIYLSQAIPKKVFLTISLSICAIFLLDEFYNLVITNLFHLPNAVEIYRASGFKYVL